MIVQDVYNKPSHRCVVGSLFRIIVVSESRCKMDRLDDDLPPEEFHPAPIVEFICMGLVFWTVSFLLGCGLAMLIEAGLLDFFKG